MSQSPCLLPGEWERKQVYKIMNYGVSMIEVTLLLDSLLRAAIALKSATLDESDTQALDLRTPPSRAGMIWVLL